MCGESCHLLQVSYIYHCLKCHNIVQNGGSSHILPQDYCYWSGTDTCCAEGGPWAFAWFVCKFWLFCANWWQFAACWLVSALVAECACMILQLKFSTFFTASLYIVQLSGSLFCGSHCIFQHAFIDLDVGLHLYPCTVENSVRCHWWHVNKH